MSGKTTCKQRYFHPLRQRIGIHAVAVLRCGSPGHTLQCTVRFRYNVVNFIKIEHKGHPIVRPLGRGMGCLLWIQSLIYFLPQSYHCCVQYYSILDPVITALDCITRILQVVHILSCLFLSYLPLSSRVGALTLVQLCLVIGYVWMNHTIPMKNPIPNKKQSTKRRRFIYVPSFYTINLSFRSLWICITAIGNGYDVIIAFWLMFYWYDLSDLFQNVDEK